MVKVTSVFFLAAHEAHQAPPILQIYQLNEKPLKASVVLPWVKVRCNIYILYLPLLHSSPSCIFSTIPLSPPFSLSLLSLVFNLPALHSLVSCSINRWWSVAYIVIYSGPAHIFCLFMPAACIFLYARSPMYRKREKREDVGPQGATTQKRRLSCHMVQITI